MLLAAPEDKKISVLPILGMGGIGKTTLAREIFHHENVKRHFGKKIWIFVSMNFDEMTLLKKILETVTKQKCPNFLTKEVVLDKIHKRLKDKQRKPYLLVLDDFWNDNFDEWDNFQTSLSGICSVNANCILVTTRKHEVSKIVRTFDAYQLSNLQKEECWSIIKAKSFLKGDISTEFEETGKCFAQICGGLPLGANVLGGLLRGKSKYEWKSMNNRIMRLGLNGVDWTNTVTKILKLSYDHLPSPSAKKCFAYCSLFPRGFKIEREKLIMLWIAEGFLQTKGENDMEAVGDEIFNLLLHNSLFQHAQIDKYGTTTHCRMHELVYDLAWVVSGFRTIHAEIDELTYVHQTRYLAIIMDESRVLLEEAKHLRTIFVNCEIAENVFVDFKRLHVLKITCWETLELPSVIEELIHLRFVDISETKIEQLPDSIGKLYNLQTLCTSSVEKLPNTLVDLVKLRHLRIPDSVQLPPGMGKLTSLRTLQCYKVHNDKGRKIGELKSLKYLKGKLEIQNLEMVKDKAEVWHADLRKKSNILKLVLRWNASKGGRNDEDVLDGLQPHPSLKCLEIRGYSGINFPLWAIEMEVGNPGKGLNNLVDIKLDDCPKCEKIPMLGHLPCLKFLFLDSLSSVQSIGLSFYGSENCSTSSAFPTLEKLTLHHMLNLTEWVNAETRITVFPCLESLIIILCPVLKVVPNHFPHLKHLEVFNVDAGFSLANVCHDTSFLQSVTIDSLPGLTCLPKQLFVKNRNLTDVHITLCPNLTHLVSGPLRGGTSLKKLTIYYCENLEELPNDLFTLQSLEKLDVAYCSKLEPVLNAVAEPEPNI